MKTKTKTKTMKAAMFLLLISWVAAQPQTRNPRPDFQDFAVEKIYPGPPAAPKLSKSQRTYRTVIRQGAKSRVEFGGHYTVPVWGCGSGCNSFVVADSISGAVYDGFVVADLPVGWVEKHHEYARMEFHPNSRLLKINGCPGEQNCGFYDYEIVEGKGLKLLRKELLPKEFQ